MRCFSGVQDFLLATPGEIGWGGNGGFQAINLALQFGARRIVLLGFDMHLRDGAHWHGRHPAGLNNPSQAGVDKWRERLDAQRAFLDTIGVEVVIGTPNSALQNYPKLPYHEALHGYPEN